jgi:hypothetical protein
MASKLGSALMAERSNSLSRESRLRSVRRWTLIGNAAALPVWIIAVLTVDRGWVLAAAAVVAAFTAAHLASLSWRIRQAAHAGGSAE